MRITQATEQSQFLANVDTMEANIAQTQNELDTGLSFTSPAQNPGAAGEVANYNQTLAQSLQYTANGSSAQTGLTTEDTTLTQMQTQLQSLRDLALEANSGTVSTQNLSAIATQAQQIQSSLLGLANTQDGNGNYIFAGFASQTQPFAATATGASYAGDQGQLQVQIAAGQTVAAGDNGDTVFNQIKNGNGTFSVAAGATNSGSGLLGAATPTIPATYSAAAGPFTITFTGATTYDITSNGVTTAGTGTYTAPAGTITYGGVQVALTGQPGASVAAAAGNTGTGVPGAVVLPNSNTYTGGAFTIKFNTPTTYSITDASGATANGSYTPPAGTITYGGVQVPLTGQPAANDSFNVALDTFTVTPSKSQSVFTTVQNLITAIQNVGGSAAARTQLSNTIAGSLNDIDQALNNASTVQAGVGGRLNAITTQQSVASSQQLQLQSSIASLQGLDYASALTTLESQNTTLSAALQAFGLTQGLTLFKYIS
jgi:flagellar hook-associated protein 3 FlgL